MADAKIPCCDHCRYYDPVGRVFGHLTVIGIAPKQKDLTRRWICRCDCGTVVNIRTTSLRKGTTNSCGCLRKAWAGRIHLTHGLTGSPGWHTWIGILSRCLNPRNKNFSNYGGRGITICDEWRESFERFIADVGPRPSPSHSLDRINNDGSYEPGNVRWATKRTQAQNRRNTVLITHDGITTTAGEWSSRTGIEEATIRARIKLGWSPKRALTTPSIRDQTHRR